MTDQHYAPPESNVQETSNHLQSLIVPLSQTKPWARLCSVLGFVSTVFMVIAALGMMLGGSALGEMAGMGFGLGIVYLVLSVFYFVPSLFLFKYASAIGNAMQTESVADISEALVRQKSFWKFVGIFMMVMVIIAVIGMVAAIVIPSMM